MFISYAEADAGIANRLRDDLENYGAEVWQFEGSAVPGTDAWGTILEAIKESGFFIVLWSQASTNSRSVQEEIRSAHYRHVNSGGWPAIIPAVLSTEVDLPTQIERFVRITISEPAYNAGLSGIINAMGLDYRDSPFSRATECAVVETRSTEFDPKRECLFYFSSLIERNPSIRTSYDKLTQKTKEAAGGRFRIGGAQIIEWKIPAFTNNFRALIGTRELEAEYLIFQPLIFGYHRGYLVEDHIVAKIRVQQIQIFNQVSEDNFEIHNDTLSLTFEGFVDVALSRLCCPPTTNT